MRPTFPIFGYSHGVPFFPCTCGSVSLPHPNLGTDLHHQYYTAPMKPSKIEKVVRFVGLR